MDKVSITFEERHGNYSVYTIRLDGVVIANVYGSMAAIVTEAVCRYLESGKETIKVGDLFDRVRAQAGGGSNDESENRNL